MTKTANHQAIKTKTILANPVKTYKRAKKIDVSKFNERTKHEGKTVFRDPETKFMLSKDVAGNRSHGGSYWKLLDKDGKRIATLSKDGDVLRK